MFDKTLSRHASDLAFSLFIMAVGLGLHLPLYANYPSWNEVRFSTPTMAFLSCVVGLLLGFVAFGGLSDRMGRRPVMMMAWVLSITSSALMLMFPDARTLAITRFMQGLGTALMLPTAVAYMQALMANSKNRTSDPPKAIYWVTISTTTGICLGPALTSACVTLLPLQQGLSLDVQAIGLMVAFICLHNLPEPVARQPFRLRPPAVQLPHFTALGNWYGASSLLVWSMAVGLLGAALGSQAKVSWLLPGLGLTVSVMAGGGVCAHLLIRYMPPKQSARIGFILFLFAQTVILLASKGPVLFLSLFGFFWLGCACLGFVFWGGLASACKAAGSEQARGSAAYLLLVSLGLSSGLVFFDDFREELGSKIGQSQLFLAWFVLGVILFFTRNRPTLAPKHRLTEGVDASLNMEQTAMGLDNVPTRAPVFVVEKSVSQRIRLTAIVLGLVYSVVIRIYLYQDSFNPLVFRLCFGFLAFAPMVLGAMAIWAAAGRNKIAFKTQVRQTIRAINVGYITVFVLTFDHFLLLVLFAPMVFIVGLLGGLVAGFLHNTLRVR